MRCETNKMCINLHILVFRIKLVILKFLYEKTSEGTGTQKANTL